MGTERPVEDGRAAALLAVRENEVAVLREFIGRVQARIWHQLNCPAVNDPGYEGPCNCGATALRSEAARLLGEET